MSVVGGSNLTTSGLVMCLDAADGSSYSPNVHPAPLDIYAWAAAGGAYQATLSRDFSTSPSPAAGIPMLIATANPGTSSYTGSYNNSTWNLAPAATGETWTMSFWVKGGSTFTGSAMIFEANSSGGYTNLSQTTYTVTPTWTRVSFSRTFTDATTAYIQVRFDCYNTSVNMWVDGLQVEKSSVATTFNPRTNTNGTSWLDLSGNNINGTINSGEWVPSGYLRNYSNATNFFYISVPDSTLLSNTLSATTGGWTIEEALWTNSVTYPEADAGTVASGAAYGVGATGFDWNHGIGNTQFKFGQSSNSASAYEEEVSVSLSSPYSDLNSWKLRTMIWNRSANTVALYINGVYQGGGSTPLTAGTAIYDGGGISFGTLYGWKHYGRRSLIRIYNKALSQAEIATNFYAIRGRLGI